MKKALDQTVRTMKREVNKKVLKVPEIERKVLEATCNEPWGPHGTLMADIAQATRNFNEYQMIMTILWKRLNDSGRNWRHVFKSLTVMEFLVGHGAERFIDDLREHTYQIQTLVDFQYIDSSGRDQGMNVRRKAQSLVALINDKEKIREYRQKAFSNRDKYRSSGMYRASSYSSTGGSYGEREEDDRYGRYGSDDRYSRDRDDRYDDRSDRYRDGDRYRDDSRSGYRNGDRYDSSERDRDRDRAGYDDARSSGSKEEEDWKADRRQPRSRPSPPSYEEVSGPDTKTNGVVAPPEEAPKPSPNVQAESPVDEFDPRNVIHASASSQDLAGQDTKKLASTLTAPASFMDAVEELFADTTLTPASSVDIADTNPFGAAEFHAAGDGFSSDKSPNSAFESTGDSQDLQALAIVPVDAPQAPEQTQAPAPAPAPAPPVHQHQPQQPQAFPSFQAQSFPQQQPQAPPPPSYPFQQQFQQPQAFPPPVFQQAPGFAQQQSFPRPQQQAFAPQQSFPQQTFTPQQSFAQQQQAFPPQQQAPQPQFQQEQPQFQPPQQQPQHQTSFHSNPKKQEVFQPKSAVWADTLNSGLVNLNIGPLKHDPLAELGIHITESKVSASQNRKEEKSVASANMGKAMGSGTGLGMVGASIMHRPPPPPPPIMMGGMGMAPPGGGMPPPGPMMMNAGPIMAPPGMPMMNGMGVGMGMGMGMGGYGNQYNGYR